MKIIVILSTIIFVGCIDKDEKYKEDCKIAVKRTTLLASQNSVKSFETWVKTTEPCKFKKPIWFIWDQLEHETRFTCYNLLDLAIKNIENKVIKAITYKYFCRSNNLSERFSDIHDLNKMIKNLAIGD